MMVEVEEALEALLLEGLKRPQLSERVAVTQADGRFLGESVRAPRDMPFTNYSAMDGYALRFSDLPEKKDLATFGLHVAGECRTGHGSINPKQGEAVRIFTGATIPEAADTVVMQENVVRSGDQITLLSLPQEGQNIRLAGEDLRAGEVGLPAGLRLNPFRLSLLASLERAEVLVRCLPRVTILCSGDELRAPGQLQGGGLAESNSVSIAALARRAGAEVVVGDYLADDLESTRQTLAAACATSDLVITVGGVSVGDHDLIRPAALALGGEYIFEKVKMKPGKPVTALKLEGALLLGLPGNPSSAQVTFALFGLPLLKALQSGKNQKLPLRPLRLKDALKQRAGRRTFYRGIVKGDEVELLSNQSSGASTAIAWANAFVSVPAEVSELESGSMVESLLFAELFA